MKISKRLQAIADMISNESKVIDVGCDHALLDIYLSMKKNCTCIAADINSNALDQAKYNIKRFGATNIETVLTDGLQDIEVSKDDIIVISGMGASTIEHILTGSKASDTLIISAHNEWENIRKVVVSLDYKIEEEKFVEDKGKSYIIIKFVKGEGEYSNSDLLYGPYLKSNISYLEYLYNKTKEVFEKIPDDNNEKELKKTQLDEIESLIKELK